MGKTACAREGKRIDRAARPERRTIVEVAGCYRKGPPAHRTQRLDRTVRGLLPAQTRGPGSDGAAHQIGTGDLRDRWLQRNAGPQATRRADASVSAARALLGRIRARQLRVLPAAHRSYLRLLARSFDHGDHGL